MDVEAYLDTAQTKEKRLAALHITTWTCKALVVCGSNLQQWWTRKVCWRETNVIGVLIFYFFSVLHYSSLHTLVTCSLSVLLFLFHHIFSFVMHFLVPFSHSAPSFMPVVLSVLPYSCWTYWRTLSLGWPPLAALRQLLRNTLMPCVLIAMHTSGDYPSLL